MDKYGETEFFEGVRAQLIDKDKRPKWRHESVADVTFNEIDHFFKSTDTINLDITKYEVPESLAP